MGLADDKSLGIFEYIDSGFIINLKSCKTKILWSEIESLEGYKRDLMTIDQICLNIIVEKKVLTISEDTEGFMFFVNCFQKQFPEIDKDWLWKLDQPPFATNFTIIYKKK